MKMPERNHTPHFTEGTGECIVCGEMTERECRTCDEPVCEACAEEHATEHVVTVARGLSLTFPPHFAFSRQQQEVLEGLFPSSVQEVAA